MAHMEISCGIPQTLLSGKPTSIWHGSRLNQDDVLYLPLVMTTHKIMLSRTTVEICIAMIAASIPSLKPIFKAILSGSSAEYQPNQRSTQRGYIVPSATSKNAIFEMHSRRSGSMVMVSGGNYLNDESKDSILEHQSGITKTVELSVSVSID